MNSARPLLDPALCRCCRNIKRCRLLTAEYEFEKNKEIYSEMILDCFGLLLSNLDVESECGICATCVLRLRDASAFHKQVLTCEEILLTANLKREMESKLKDNEDQIQEEEIKSEPEDNRSPLPSPSHSLPPQDFEICNQESTSPHNLKNESNVESDSADDLPLIHRAKRRKPSGENKLFNIKSLDEREKLESKRKGNKLVNKVKRKNSGNEEKKHREVNGVNKVPMSKMQEMIREKDTSYMAENNILNIVEFSYVCPFKCRHNHLLCYYCGQVFQDPTQLRMHSQNEHNPKKFKIIECKKMIKIDLTRIDCRLCDAKIDSLDEFKKHLSVHGKKYYFNIKDAVLPFRLSKEDWKCAMCEEKFPYFHALNKHMNKHYSNYVCETCGLGFVDNARFVMHLQRHEEGDFPCETCGKIFKAQYNRDLHVDRVHNKRGRVFCPKCDVRLMSYAQKLKHLVSVHGETPLSFPCARCERVCDTRRGLTIHMRKDHLNDYRYDCSYCGQKFFTRFALNNHTPTHTGERNFKCKVCDKSYPRLKTLKDHMRIHTNDRRYRCHVCAQAFIQNCSLKSHMKSQHTGY